MKKGNIFEISNKHHYLDSLKNNPLFCLVFNSINDGVLITNSEGIVKYINEAYSRITGVNINEILNKPVSQVRYGSRLPEVLATGNPLYGIKRKVNQTEYIADIAPITIQNEIIGAISIVRDITMIENLIRKVDVYSSKFNQLKNKVNDLYKAKYNFTDIVGTNVGIKNAKDMAKRVAISDVYVLIYGETGTGKELFAHAIHNSSNRNENAFIAINCAAFPPNLLLSELFGYEEGSFTGASKGGKLGLFEIANNGTLFLDEIGDMDFELQAKLLRVLETGEFIRIGGTKPIKVNVRIISATNKDLEELIRSGKFREDLFYRLNTVSIKLPPLRERLDDIPLLVEEFLKGFRNKLQKNYSISDEALSLLCKYNFPGNIRELKNIIELAVNTCEDHLITVEHLPIKVKNLTKNNKLNIITRNTEKEVIVKALERHGKTVKGKREVAKELGISLATLYNKIKQYDI